jgi:hypothetical protein
MIANLRMSDAMRIKLINSVWSITDIDELFSFVDIPQNIIKIAHRKHVITCYGMIGGVCFPKK